MTTDVTVECAAAWAEVGAALALALEAARRAAALEDLDERAALAARNAQVEDRAYSKFEWMPVQIERLLEDGFGLHVHTY